MADSAVRRSIEPYVTPMDMLVGRQMEIQSARDRKLEEARQKGQLRPPGSGIVKPCEDFKGLTLFAGWYTFRSPSRKARPGVA